MSNDLNHYQVLGVARNASSRDIRKAHLKMALALHPDKTGLETNTYMAKLNEAKEVLLDEQSRMIYDQELEQGSTNNGRNENSAEMEALRRQLAHVHQQLMQKEQQLGEKEQQLNEVSEEVLLERSLREQLKQQCEVYFRELQQQVREKDEALEVLQLESGAFQQQVREKEEALQREREQLGQAQAKNAKANNHLALERREKERALEALQREKENNREHLNQCYAAHTKLHQKYEEMQGEMKKTQLKFHCGRCSGIVPSTNFWQSGCCAKLFCGDCLRGVTHCPNIFCQKAIQPLEWKHNDPLIKTLIENVSRTLNQSS